MNYTEILFSQLDIRVKEENIITKIGEKILNNQLVIVYKQIPSHLDESIPSLIFNDEFNWDMNFGDKNNIGQFNLQSFTPIRYLLQCYNFKSDKKYLNKALELLFSWQLYYDHNGVNNTYVWYDHCVSERGIILLLLKKFLLDENISTGDELVQSLLKQHQQFLFEDENYVYGNHGLMMDRTLYAITKELKNDSTYISKSLYRMEKLFDETFTINGINIENSTSYHLYNLDLFLLIQKKLLNYFNDSISKTFDKKIEKALKYVAIFSSPSGKFPNFGDGGRFNINQLSERLTREFYLENPYILYIYTNGEKGKKLEQQSYYFDKEGYYYYKDDETFITFKSGKIINNHKHADDLSISYIFNEEDILVDSGTYTYQMSNIRKYFMSSRAHNTILIDNANYDFLEDSFNKVSLLHFEENENYKYIIGKNDTYAKGNITRHLIITKENNIIIYDEVDSIYDISVKQTFNLHPDFNSSTVSMKDSKIMFKKPNHNKKLVIKQYLDSQTFLLNGLNNTGYEGSYSEHFYRINKLYSINTEAMNKQFLTTISYSEDDNISVSKNNNILKVLEKKHTYEINLKTIDRPLTKSSTVETFKIKNNFYVFKCEYDYDIMEAEYAWYIYQNDKRIDQVWYTESNILEYQFSVPGNYRIQYFVRDKKNKNNKYVEWVKDIIEITDIDVI